MSPQRERGPPLPLRPGAAAWGSSPRRIQRPLLEKEAAALGPGVARGGDGELPGGASAPDLAGEAMAPVVAAMAGPVLGVVVGREGGHEELPTPTYSELTRPYSSFYIFQKFFTECRFSTRQSVCRVLNKKTLGKDSFAESLFAECRLPSVTLGEAFAVGKAVFAECFLGFAVQSYRFR